MKIALQNKKNRNNGKHIKAGVHDLFKSFPRIIPIHVVFFFFLSNAERDESTWSHWGGESVHTKCFSACVINNRSQP